MHMGGFFFALSDRCLLKKPPHNIMFTVPTLVTFWAGGSRKIRYGRKTSIETTKDKN